MSSAYLREQLAGLSGSEGYVSLPLSVAQDLLATIDVLTERVVRLEQERAQARAQAFTNAARIADGFVNHQNRSSGTATAAAIAARLRARAAVGVPQEAT